MIIVLFLVTIIITLAAIAVCASSAHINSMVSGEKLLTLNSKLGYQYATTYHSWQIYATIAAIATVVVWVIFVCIFIKHRKKRKKQKIEAMKSKV